MSIKPLTLALTSSYLLSTALVSAAQILSESFDTATYTAGDDIVGQNAWTGDAGYVADNVTVNATGLTHANVLGATDGSLNGTVSFSSGGQGWAIGPTVGTDSALGNSTQYWFSALMSLVGNGDSAESVVVNLSFDSASTGGFVFGLTSSGAGGSGSSDGYGFVAGAQATNSGNLNYISGDGFIGDPFTYVGGDTILVVGRMTVVDANASGAVEDGKEILDYWINPTNTTDAASIAATAEATMQQQDFSLLNGLWGSVRAGAVMSGSGVGESYVDEIRVGTSVADLGLATIPEPSSYALLLGLVAMAGVCVRRRA